MIWSVRSALKRLYDGSTQTTIVSSCIEYIFFGNVPALLTPRNIDVVLRVVFNPLLTGKRGLLLVCYLVGTTERYLIGTRIRARRKEKGKTRGLTVVFELRSAFCLKALSQSELNSMSSAYVQGIRAGTSCATKKASAEEMRYEDGGGWSIRTRRT